MAQKEVVATIFDSVYFTINGTTYRRSLNQVINNETTAEVTSITDNRFTLNEVTYIIENNQIIKEVNPKFLVALRSRSSNYSSWEKTAECQMINVVDGYANQLDCTYKVQIQDDAREIYVYSLYTVNYVTGESNVVSYISDYSGPNNHVNKPYGNNMSGYNPEGVTDKCLNIDYNNPTDCAITRNIIFDSHSPIVEVDESTPISSSCVTGNSLFTADGNLYLNAGCSGTFNLIVKEANYEELLDYINRNSFENLNKIRVYSYNPDGSLLYLDTSNAFVEVTKTAVLGSTYTLVENSKEITIRLIIISIKVDVLEEQYISIVGSNRYNVDEGVYTQANDGEYLKVGADYYYIHESNRYNYIDFGIYI